MDQIIKTTDVMTEKVIINRISDVPGGVSLTVSDLVSGNIVKEGTPLTAPSSGKRTVCKQAKVLSGSTTTAIKVESGTHHFKVDDPVGIQESGKAYKITGITTSGDVDTIAVGTAIDTLSAGDFLYEMKAETSDSSELANDPDVILKSAFKVPSNTQVIVIADALVRADVKEAYIGGLYLADLDVNEIKY